MVRAVKVPYLVPTTFMFDVGFPAEPDPENPHAEASSQLGPFGSLRRVNTSRPKGSICPPADPVKKVRPSILLSFVEAFAGESFHV